MRGVVCGLALALIIGPVPPHEGLAVRYSEGVMEAVAHNRGIPPTDCMVAYTYAEAEDMGKLWLEVEGIATGVRRRCLTADLPRPHDRPNLIRRNVLVELDANSARSICGAAWRGKASECPVRVRAVQSGRVPQGRGFYDY